MRITRAKILAAALLLAGSVAAARHIAPEVARVPVARLIRNLEKKIEAEPKKAEHHYALARVYSMAYAKKAETFYAVKEPDGEPALYNGSGPAAELPPQDIVEDGRPKPIEPERLKQATEWLGKAIAEYKHALRLGLKGPAQYLGLGWCYEQAGDKDGAKYAYRKGLDAAWVVEASKESFFELSMTAETGGALKRLLDPHRDAKEIAEIDRRISVIGKRGMAITPILVPLKGGAALSELVRPDARVEFDLDGSGVPRRWGWITPDAAWLVFDADKTGRIESGRQLIGGFSFMIFWKNGYEALFALDDDGDGELRGDELDGLALWRDANGNGVSEQGEVKPVEEEKIVALSCSYSRHETGIPYSPSGATFDDGTIRPTYDWIAEARPE